MSKEKSPAVAEKPDADKQPGEPTTAPVNIVPEPEWETTEPPEVKIGRTDDIRRLATALAAAQGEMENAQKSQENKHFSTTYADLAAVVDVIRLPLSRYQIARTQIVNYNETETWLDSILIHGPSGQYISCRWPLPHKMVKSQDFMAAVTYAKRGSMMALLGIAAENEDDDGETTAGRGADTHDAGEQRQPAKTRQRLDAEQWVPYAVRKVKSFATEEELSAFEEKHRQDLVGLAKIFPDGHKEVMDAIQATNARLAGHSGE